MSGEQPEQRKRRVYDIVVDEGGPVRREEQDPLDEVIQDRDRQLAQDIKRTRAEAILAEEQRRKRQAERGVQVDDGTGVVDLSQAMRQQPSVSTAGGIVTGLIQGGMSPEKAQEFIRNLAPEDIAKLNMFAAAPRTGGMDPMMALMLLGKFGSQKEVSVADMLSIGPKFVESAKTLSEMSRPSGGSELVGLLTKMVEESGKDRAAGVQAQIDILKSKLEGSDPIASTASAIKALKDTGLIAERGGETKPEIDLKIEEMRTSRELEMTKLRIDMNKWMTEKNAETERWNSILTTAPAALALFAKPLEEAVRGAARQSSGQTTVQQPATQERMVQGAKLVCGQCQTELTVLEPFPSTVTCPKCGHAAPFPKG